MTDENSTKIREILKNSNKIAVILQEKIGIDEYCSAIALNNYLIGLKKEVTIFTSCDQLPSLGFMDAIPQIGSSFNNSNDLVIRINSRTAKPKQLRYEKQGEDLAIHIIPESGQIPAEDVEVLANSGSFDLLILLGVKSMDKLGALLESSPETFYQTTKIVISNYVDQEYFGAVNWVEPNVLSLSEVIAKWLLGQADFPNQDNIATPLLAGIISQTQSYRDPRTTPETLSISAKLVKGGARQQDIIQHLFKTKPFNLLQLWGRAMARVKLEAEHRVLYTVLTKQDFERSSAGIDLVPQAVAELVSMAPDYQLLVVGAETDQGLQVFMAGPQHVKLKKLAKALNENATTSPEPLLGNHQITSVLVEGTTIDNIEDIVKTITSSF